MKLQLSSSYSFVDHSVHTDRRRDVHG